MTRAVVFDGTTGDEPLAFGAEALTDHGLELTTPRRLPLPSKAVAVVRDRTGVRIDQPGLPAIRGADLALGYFEPNLHYPAALTRLPLSPMRRTPLVSLVCWAAEDLLSGSDQQRRRTLRILRASRLVCFLSANQAAVLAEHGVAEERLVPLRFGVDLDRVADAGPVARDIDLLTVGQDAGRDPGTLAAAIAGTGVSLRVVAPPERVGALAEVPEATLLGRVAFEDYLTLLRRARTVVVATHELAYPTGQTVALEAAAAGCAVIVTGTPAMGDYFTDGVTALMPAVGDARALRAAIEATRRDETMRVRLAEAGREHVLRHHGTDQMWAGLARAVQERGVVAPWS